MNVLKVFSTYIICLLMHSVHCARILGVFPLSGKSLNILYNKLMRGLADAGHEVTVVSPRKNPNPVTNGSYTDILLTGFVEEYEKNLDGWMRSELETETASSPITSNILMHEFIFPIYTKTILHPNVQKLLKENRQFDLVITEYMWSGEMLFTFAKFYNCPLVLFTHMGGVNPWIHNIMGNPLPMSYVPHYWMIDDFSNGLSFTQRIHNLVFYLADVYYTKFISIPDQNKIIAHITPQINDVAELYNLPCLVLMGTHVSILQSTPMAPNIIEIGGFHIEPPKQLPDDLKDFLDNAKEGVIYFSMGSHIKGTHFSSEKKKMWINIFKSLKQRVLWKYEDEIDVSDNVIVRKWLPQMDILAHPNIKLFITHGGYGSTQETVYHGVPSLMIPVFLDQFNNAKTAEGLGFGLSVLPGSKNFNEITLKQMIKEILQNPKYSENAKHVSSLFHDRPISPLNNAIYWIDYVIRHNGAEHLKVAGIKLPWYQLYMIDVLLFLMIIVSLTIFMLSKLSKAVRSLQRKGTKEKIN